MSPRLRHLFALEAGVHGDHVDLPTATDLRQYLDDHPWVELEVMLRGPLSLFLGACAGVVFLNVLAAALWLLGRL